MPRKSSRLAARYAKSSKRKKGKKRSPTQAPHQTPVSSTPKVREDLVAQRAIRPELPTAASTTPSDEIGETASDQKYVVDELRRIAMVAGLMFLIIIALAFLLR